jgi:hypothetical protein
LAPKAVGQKIAPRARATVERLSLERGTTRLMIGLGTKRPSRTKSVNDYGASGRCFQGEHGSGR